MTKTNTQKQFEDAISHLHIMLDKAPVRVEDVKYLLDAAEKISMEFERVYKSRANWRNRAEIAEYQLKNIK